MIFILSPKFNLSLCFHRRSRMMSCRSQSSGNQTSTNIDLNIKNRIIFYINHSDRSSSSMDNQLIFRLDIFVMCSIEHRTGVILNLFVLIYRKPVLVYSLVYRKPVLVYSLVYRKSVLVYSLVYRKPVLVYSLVYRKPVLVYSLYQSYFPKTSQLKKNNTTNKTTFSENIIYLQVLNCNILCSHLETSRLFVLFVRHIIIYWLLFLQRNKNPSSKKVGVLNMKLNCIW